MTVMMLRSKHKRFCLAFVHVRLALLWYVHLTDSLEQDKAYGNASHLPLPSFIASIKSCLKNS